MKNFVKFIPATLMAAALVGCSGDELYVEGQVKGRNAGLASNFTVEQPIFDDAAATRGGYKYESNSFLFTAGDEARVYDGDLNRYDLYRFNGTDAFVNTGEYSHIKGAEFALFPAKYVAYGNWLNDGTKDGAGQAVVTIPSLITYAEEAEQTIDGDLVYASFVPMWGTAQDAGEMSATAQLQFMTAGLVVTLENTKGSVKYLKVSSEGKSPALSGSFEAILKDGAELVQHGEALEKGLRNYILVDMEQAPRVGRSVITLPIICGQYETLKVDYIDKDKVGGETDLDKIAALTGWENIHTYGKNGGLSSKNRDVKSGKSDDGRTRDNYEDFKTFKRKTLYRSGNTKIFDVTHSNPESLSAALNERLDMSGVVTLNIEEPFSVESSTMTSKYTVYVPQMKNVQKVVINCKKGLDFSAANGKGLIIKDKTNDYFAGEIVLNVGEAAKFVNDTEGIVVDLKKAKITLAGGLNGKDNTNKVTVNCAETLTIGDGTATELNGTNLFASGVNSAICVEKGAKVTNTLTVPANKKSFKLVINGEVETADAKVAETVEVRGNVTTKLSTEGKSVLVEAYNQGQGITGEMALNGKNVNSEINLKSGNINTITTSLSGKDEPKNVTITNVESKPTFIGTIGGNFRLSTNITDAANQKQIITLTGSTWCGTKLDAASFTDQAEIYTASHLAADKGTQNYVLWTDMNLKGASWTCPALTAGSFNGQSGKFKISNLNLTQSGNGKGSAVEAADNTGRGLFSELKANVSNLKIETVTFTQPANVTSGTKKYYQNANVGAVAGKVTAAVTISNVVVDGVTFKNTNKDLYNVGALVGDATAALALNKNEVKNVSIEGYYNIGGLVGCLDATSTFTQNKIDVTKFSVNKDLASGKESDVNYGTVGLFVGHCGDNVKLTIRDQNIVANKNAIDGNRKNLKFHQHKLYVPVNNETKEMFFFGDNNCYVGFSSTSAELRVTDGIDYTDYRSAYKGINTMPDNMNANLTYKSGDFIDIFKLSEDEIK